MVRNNRGEAPGGFPPDEPSHPLYLHPNDNSGSVLVTELLTGSNYLNWSKFMHTALLTKNKVGLIVGSVPRPDNCPENTEMLNVWIRCNNMVVSWLRNSTAPQIKSSLLYLNTASHIWFDLKD